MEEVLNIKSEKPEEYVIILPASEETYDSTSLGADAIKEETETLIPHDKLETNFCEGSDDEIEVSFEYIDLHEDTPYCVSMKQEPEKIHYSYEVPERQKIKIDLKSLKEDSKSTKVSNSIPKKYLCFNCKKAFVRKKLLVAHFLAHHNGKDKIKFPYVPRKGESEKKRIFRCDKCPWKFATKGTLKAHFTHAHSDYRPFECDFPRCLKSYKSIQEKEDHIRSVHTKERPHGCEKCDKKFKLSHHLKEHGIRVHEKTKDRTLPCNLCKKKFFNQLDLKVHEKRSHMK